MAKQWGWMLLRKRLQSGANEVKKKKKMMMMKNMNMLKHHETKGMSMDDVCIARLLWQLVFQRYFCLTLNVPSDHEHAKDAVTVYIILQIACF